MQDEELARALSHIPADDYRDWFRVGRALHNHFGDQGFAMFDAWSKGGEYSPRGAERQWRALARNADPSITLGTVYHLARQHGWRPSR